jgi:hypothetical protein
MVCNLRHDGIKIDMLYLNVLQTLRDQLFC